MKEILFKYVVLAMLCCSLAACSKTASKAQTGAVAGAVVGAGVGAITGSAVGEVGAGIAIGASAGALAGGTFGRALDKVDEQKVKAQEIQREQDIIIEQQQRELEDLKRQKYYDNIYRSYY